VALDRVPDQLEEAMMRRIIAVLVPAILFAGCAVDGEFKKRKITGGPCGDVSGYTYTGIAYGDSTIAIIPISKIRANTEWRFFLLPIKKQSDLTDWKGVDVKVKGKVASGSQTADYNDWINVSGNFNASKSLNRKGYIVDCVPKTVLEGEIYNYEVAVRGIGKIDPRGRVEK
jgi:hypothetical protein